MIHSVFRLCLITNAGRELVIIGHACFHSLGDCEISRPGQLHQVEGVADSALDMCRSRARHGDAHDLDEGMAEQVKPSHPVVYINAGINNDFSFFCGTGSRGHLF